MAVNERLTEVWPLMRGGETWPLMRSGERCGR